jgi:hypothetical protein
MTRFIPLIAVVLMACAAPKYQYSFDHYTVGTKSDAVAIKENATQSPLLVKTEDLTVSASPLTHMTPDAPMANASNNKRRQIESGKKPVSISREDRKQLARALKEFRRDLRARSGKHYAAPPHDQATQKLDTEVITAIAFGAVGITLSLLGGISAAFWIAGVICLGVGVYFFIDWLQHR